MRQMQQLTKRYPSPFVFIIPISPLYLQDDEIASLQSKLELKTRHFDEVHTALTVNAQELAALRAETRRKAQVDSARHEKYEDMKVANSS